MTTQRKSDRPLAGAPLARLLAAVQPLAPAPESARRIRDRVLARTAGGRLPGFADIRLADGWQPLASLARMKVLHDDGETMSWLAELQPGCRLPAHEHGGAEECLVVAGEVWLNGARFAAGDYQYAAAGTHHDEVRSDGGCLLLIRSPSPRRLVAARGNGAAA